MKKRIFSSYLFLVLCMASLSIEANSTLFTWPSWASRENLSLNRFIAPLPGISSRLNGLWSFARENRVPLFTAGGFFGSGLFGYWLSRRSQVKVSLPEPRPEIKTHDKDDSGLSNHDNAGSLIKLAEILGDEVRDLKGFSSKLEQCGKQQKEQSDDSQEVLLCDSQLVAKSHCRSQKEILITKLLKPQKTLKDAKNTRVRYERQNPVSPLYPGLHKVVAKSILQKRVSNNASFLEQPKDKLVQQDVQKTEKKQVQENNYQPKKEEQEQKQEDASFSEKNRSKIESTCTDKEIAEFFKEQRKERKQKEAQKKAGDLGLDGVRGKKEAKKTLDKKMQDAGLKNTSALGDKGKEKEDPKCLIGEGSPQGSEQSIRIVALQNLEDDPIEQWLKEPIKEKSFRDLVKLKSIALPKNNLGSLAGWYNVTKPYLEYMKRPNGIEGFHNITDTQFTLKAFEGGERSILFYGTPDHIMTPDSINDFLHGSGAKDSTSYFDSKRRNLNALMCLVEKMGENAIIFPMQWSGSLDDATRQRDGLNYASAVKALPCTDNTIRRAFVHSHAANVFKRASQEEGFPKYALLASFCSPIRPEYEEAYRLNAEKVDLQINAYSPGDLVQGAGGDEIRNLPFKAFWYFCGYDFGARKEGKLPLGERKGFNLRIAYAVKADNGTYSYIQPHHGDWTPVLENLRPILEQLNQNFLVGNDINLLLARDPESETVNVHLGLRNYDTHKQELEKLEYGELRTAILEQYEQENQYTKEQDALCQEKYGFEIHEARKPTIFAQAYALAASKAQKMETDLVPRKLKEFTIQDYSEIRNGGEASGSPAIMGSPIIQDYTPPSSPSAEGNALPFQRLSPASLALEFKQ